MPLGNTRFLIATTLIALSPVLWMASLSSGDSPAVVPAVGDHADPGAIELVVGKQPEAHGSRPGNLLQAIASDDGGTPGSTVRQAQHTHPHHNHAHRKGTPERSGLLRGGLLGELFGGGSRGPARAEPVRPTPPRDGSSNGERQPVDWAGIPYHEANPVQGSADRTPIRDPGTAAGRSSSARPSETRIIRGGAARTLDATGTAPRTARRVEPRPIPQPEPLAESSNAKASDPPSLDVPRVSRKPIQPLSRNTSSRRSGRRPIEALQRDRERTASGRVEGSLANSQGSSRRSIAGGVATARIADNEESRESVSARRTGGAPAEPKRRLVPSADLTPKVARKQIPVDEDDSEPAPAKPIEASRKAAVAADRSAAPSSTSPASPSDVASGPPAIPYAASHPQPEPAASTPEQAGTEEIPADQDSAPADEVLTLGSPRSDTQRRQPERSMAEVPSAAEPEVPGRRGDFVPLRPVDESSRDLYGAGSYPLPGDGDGPDDRESLQMPGGTTEPADDSFAARGRSSDDVSLQPIATGRYGPSPAIASGPAAGAPGTPSAAPPTMPLVGDAGQFRGLQATEAAVATELPGIRVVTRGPREIMIRQTHQYEVRVENRGSIDAEGILVRTLVPQGASVEGHSVARGSVESEPQAGGQRLDWEIDRLAAGQTVSLFVRIEAARSGTFDLDVDWTLLPIKSVATVRVQEPRLELTIDGPEEVVYGQSQTYRVRVLNPGDGTAPDVVFTLSPESPTPQTQRIGDIPAGKEAQFEVELTAQDLGDLKIHGLATGGLDLRAEAAKTIRVAAARLEAVLAGPELKYQNTEATYRLELQNHGLAASESIVAVLRLPAGVEYLGGIEGAQQRGNQLRWQIDSLTPGGKQAYEFRCKMSTTGEQRFAFDCRGSAAGEAQVILATRVNAIADLVLTVNDPPAPAPVGQPVRYDIVIRNRGSKEATAVQVIAQFSHGIEPQRVEGHQAQVMTGQVLFDPIDKIAAGEEVRLEVIATADQTGHHRFRTEVGSGDTVLVAEEATRYLNQSGERVSRRSSDSENR